VGAVVDATDTLADLGFPLLVWKPGYVGVVLCAVELSAHHRWLFEATKVDAARGELRLADTKGRVFKGRDFIRVRPFGGLKSLPYRIMFGIFAVPDLVEPRNCSLEEFKEILVNAIEDRYRYDTYAEFSKRDWVIADIRGSTNFEEALRAIPQRLLRPWRIRLNRDSAHVVGEYRVRMMQMEA
jgi:hypothetical protein